MIASLKGETEMTSSTMTSLELEEIRQDRDTARDELNMLRLEMNNLKTDFQVIFD